MLSIKYFMKRIKKYSLNLLDDVQAEHMNKIII